MRQAGFRRGELYVAVIVFWADEKFREKASPYLMGMYPGHRAQIGTVRK